MKKINIYKLGKKAQKGDKEAMLKILKIKKGLIKKYSYGDEDCYQTIILNLINGIKNYEFK